MKNDNSGKKLIGVELDSLFASMKSESLPVKSAVRAGLFAVGGAWRHLGDVNAAAVTTTFRDEYER